MGLPFILPGSLLTRVRPEAVLPSITSKPLHTLRAEVWLLSPCHSLAVPRVPGGHTSILPSSLITWGSKVGLLFILPGSLLTRVRPQAGLPSITFSLRHVVRAEMELSAILPGHPLHELAVPRLPDGHTFPVPSSLITWRSEVGLPFILPGSLLTHVRSEAGLPSITFRLLHALMAEVEMSTILPGYPLHELAVPSSLLTCVRPEAGQPSITFSLLHVLRAEVELSIIPESPEIREGGALM